MTKSILTLFFVLLIGFPQVASGEGLNLFGKDKSDDVVIFCRVDHIYVVNLGKNHIKLFTSDKGVNITYGITDVDEIYVRGNNTTHKERVIIWRFEIEELVVVKRIITNDKGGTKENDYQCMISKKNF